MMTRSRRRELNEDTQRDDDNDDNNRINNNDESQDESDDGVEISRRRMRTRNKYRIEEMDNDNIEDLNAESSIGAKAGERRRRNIQKNLIDGQIDIIDDNIKEIDLSGKVSLKPIYIDDQDKSNEIPGRIITSFDDDPNKRKKYCFECYEEIHCRKKKENVQIVIISFI